MQSDESLNTTLNVSLWCNVKQIENVIMELDHIDSTKDQRSNSNANLITYIGGGTIIIHFYKSEN